MTGRRWLGVALLGGSLITGFVLALSGTPLVTLHQAQTDSQPHGSIYWSGALSIHPPLAVLVAAGVVGLLLLPRHDKRDT